MKHFCIKLAQESTYLDNAVDTDDQWSLLQRMLTQDKLDAHWFSKGI